MYVNVYKDAKGEWRWKYLADNHKILADCGEGYVHRADCLHAISIIKSGAATANVWDSTLNPPAIIPV